MSPLERLYFLLFAFSKLYLNFVPDESSVPLFFPISHYLHHLSCSHPSNDVPFKSPSLKVHLFTCAPPIGRLRGDLWWRKLSDTGRNSGLLRQQPVFLQQPAPVPTAAQRKIQQLLPLHWEEQGSQVVCHRQCQLKHNSETLVITAAVSL